MSEPLTDAERQARYRERKKEKGTVLVNSLWVPNPLHTQLIAEANREGIPLRTLIIQKLYGAVNPDE